MKLNIAPTSWRAIWKDPTVVDTSAADKLYLISLGFGIGICVGCVISVFRHASSAAYSWLIHWSGPLKPDSPGVLFLFVGATIAALITGFLIRNPAIRSGGEEWIKKTLAGEQARPWRLILIPKFVGSFLVMAGGVSVGREGPCIQMGAATALGLKNFDSQHRLERHYFILGGCAAGLASAFSAPLAGIGYVYEVMGISLTGPLFYFMLAGAFGVYVACDLLFNLGVMLPLSVEMPGFGDLALYAPLAIIASFVGVAYNYALRGATRLYTARKIIPLFFRPLFAFWGAALMLLFFPAVTGEGLAIIDLIRDGHALLSLLLLFILAKLFFTAFCYGTGIPAGIMVPVICLGAVTGGAYAEFLGFFTRLPAGFENGCFVLGACASFVAAERAPITGVVLVAQMTGAYALLPGLVMAGGIAALLAKICKIS